jgi:hypothetical protein
MLFKTSVLALFAASTAFAAPAVEQRDVHDISVLLTGGPKAWHAVGFSPNARGEVTSPKNPGPFTNVQLIFSDKIKREIPGIETRYRCSLEDDKGGRIITTRGANIDFNFGDNNNPNSWKLKNGPFSNVKIICDPKFKKVEASEVNLVRVSLSDERDFGRQVTFKAGEVTKPISSAVGGKFRTVKLTLGPGIANQKLRCQLTDSKGKVVLADRGTNTNKKTFGDGGKGKWTLDVAGDGIAHVAKVTCDPSFA